MKCRLLTGFMLLAIQVFSQASLEETVFENIEENLQEDDLDLDDTRPIDINMAQKEEIEKFPMLHEDQINRICRERKRHRFRDWHDFQNRSGIDEDIVAWMAHYFYIGKKKEPKKPGLTLHFRERLSRFYPESAGLRSGRYPGNAWKIDQRIRLTRPGLQCGVRIEKDAGEPDWNDHQVAFISISGSRFNLIIGHYQIETGLGLSLASPFGAGKSALPETALPQYQHKLKGYLSSNETPPHFGLAAPGPLLSVRSAGLVFQEPAGRAIRQFNSWISCFRPSPYGIGENCTQARR